MMHGQLLDMDDRVYQPYLDKLKRLFDDMDAAYEKMADDHGFHCSGCEDSCCQTRFYHHTMLEYLYILEGWKAQTVADKNDILRRAARVDAAGRHERLMCPLNLAGRCRLYRFRPMICRLHGIAHEFIGPDNTARRGPGCDEFTRYAGNNPDARLDRTPFYRRMALLEKELRRRIGFNGRIHMTVARMILCAAEETHESKGQ